MELKISEKFPAAGEGAYARTDVPGNTIYSLYGGLVFTRDEFTKYKEGLDKIAFENNWNSTSPEQLATWKYR